MMRYLRHFVPVLLALVACAAGAMTVALEAKAQSVSATIPAGNGVRAIAVNPNTNRIYVANESSNSVTVIDGATNATSTIAVGPRPQYIAVNPATNRIYVSHGGDNTQAVIEGASGAVRILHTGGNGPFVVNAATNKVYMIRLGPADEVTIIDGAAHTWYSIATDSWTPVALDVNPLTNRLYVAHYTTGDVRAVDLTSTSDFPPTRSVPVWSKPTGIAVNTSTNRIYVIGEDERAPINVIDGTNYTATSFAPAGHARGPRAIAVNAATNKVYAAFNGEVIVIDGATNAMAYVATGGIPVALAVNAATNRIYAVNSQGYVTVIDGGTNAAANVTIPAGAGAIAFNSSTNKAYIGGPAITVLDGAGTAPAPPAPSGHNVQGLWWRSPQGSESGWGVNLTQQGEQLFATWFTYDAQGNGLWLVMSNGARTAANTYSGTLYQTTGPAFNSAPFDSTRVATTPVGTATFTFTDGNTGTFSYTVNGASGSKAITRQAFASPMPSCAVGGAASAAPNYQALWWGSPAGSESGWGLNMTHQGDILCVTWFTYGPDGKGMWLVGSSFSRTGNGSYAGALYRTIGPPWNAQPWNPAMVALTPVGNATLAFSDAGSGTFSYTVNGVTQSKAITRQVFASPPSVCR
jgi:YVTN family beta-propeller protein